LGFSSYVYIYFIFGRYFFLYHMLILNLAIGTWNIILWELKIPLAPAKAISTINSEWPIWNEICRSCNLCFLANILCWTLCKTFHSNTFIWLIKAKNLCLWWFMLFSRKFGLVGFSIFCAYFPIQFWPMQKKRHLS
jgi:hypothetical protein